MITNIAIKMGFLGFLYHNVLLNLCWTFPNVGWSNLISISYKIRDISNEVDTWEPHCRLFLLE